MRTLLTILLLSITLSCLGQWKASLKNLNTAQGNARLYIQPDPKVAAGSVFILEINFIQGNPHQIFLHQERRIRFEHPGETVYLDFRLPNREFILDADLRELGGGLRIPLPVESAFALNQVYRDDKRSQTFVRASDLLLSYTSDEATALSSPLLDYDLVRNNGYVFAFLQVQTSGIKALTLSYALFRETPEATTGVSQVFRSIQEGDRSILIQNGKKQMIISDTLALFALPRGEYLLDVLLYSSEVIVARGDVRFRLGGDLTEQVLQNLDVSIPKMRYIASSRKLEAWAAESSPELQKEAFLSYWVQRYPDDYLAEMESYFRKLNEADERYTENGKTGWKTDRGKIFVLYGDPDYTRTVRFRGEDYLSWSYRRWALTFVFEQRNQSYRLVELF